MTTSIDWNLSVQLANNSEDTAEVLLGMMLEQLPEFRELLTQSFNASDAKSLATHAHKLHGGCCYCGVPKLKQLIRSLEIQAKEEPPILNADLFNETMTEIDEVITRLQAKDYR